MNVGVGVLRQQKLRLRKRAKPSRFTKLTQATGAELSLFFSISKAVIITLSERHTHTHTHNFQLTHLTDFPSSETILEN